MLRRGLLYASAIGIAFVLLRSRINTAIDDVFAVFADPDLLEPVEDWWGDVGFVRAEARIGGRQKPGGEAGNGPATDHQGNVRTHSDAGTSR